MKTRTAEEVFAHHGEALVAEDLEGIIGDYADDAIIIANKQVHRGKEGARAVFTQALDVLQHATWQLDPVFADEVLYLEWKASADGVGIDNGVDTFVFRDGLIRFLTLSFTLVPA